MEIGPPHTKMRNPEVRFKRNRLLVLFDRLVVLAREPEDIPQVSVDPGRQRVEIQRPPAFSGSLFFPPSRGEIDAVPNAPFATFVK